MSGHGLQANASNSQNENSHKLITTEVYLTSTFSLPKQIPACTIIIETREFYFRKLSQLKKKKALSDVLKYDTKFLLPIAFSIFTL